MQLLFSATDLLCKQVYQISFLLAGEIASQCLRHPHPCKFALRARGLFEGAVQQVFDLKKTLESLHAYALCYFH